MSVPRSLIAAVLSLAAGACGISPLSASVDVASICKTVPDQSVAGVPLGSAQTTDVTVRYDLGDVVREIQADNRIHGDIVPLVLTLTAKSGVSDMDFVDQMAVQILPAQSSQPVELVRYTKSGPVGGTLVVPVTVQRNILPDLADGTLNIDVQFQGNLPPGNWTFDVQGCFHADGQAQL